MGLHGTLKETSILRSRPPPGHWFQRLFPLLIALGCRIRYPDGTGGAFLLYKDVVKTIQKLSRDAGLNFQTRSARIAELLAPISRDDALEHLDHMGIIPEAFDHDSTEEKLFAKYCDALLSKSLSLLGLEAEVILERSDAADVIARGDGYKIVGDAKAFRLSRTAKNQKDFKVEALNTWRKGADYAVLCSPYYQYPNSSSQIYLQASRYNVTLLSYTHIAFLIRHKASDKTGLKKLWSIGKSISASKSATAYWDALHNCMFEVSKQTPKTWQAAVDELRGRLPSQAKQEIEFWESEKIRLKGLSHDEAVKELIDALKIDSKITTIRKNSKVVL